MVFILLFPKAISILYHLAEVRGNGEQVVLNFEKIFFSTMELFIFGLRKHKILPVQID